MPGNDDNDNDDDDDNDDNDDDQELLGLNHGIMGRRFPDNFLFFRPRLDV